MSRPLNIQRTIAVLSQTMCRLDLASINTSWGYFDSEGNSNEYVPDYQGNIRAVTRGNEVVQMTDYYPYGLPMPNAVGAAANRYKYTGKEFETRAGLNSFDFQARQYGPAVPLLDTTDPKAGNYHNLSPFLFCAANPINTIDPLGTDTIRINYTDGKYEFGDISIAEGDDIFIVTKDGETKNYIFSAGEHGNRICALNLEIDENQEGATLGVYHVSGSKEAHGYYITPGGESSTLAESGARIPEGKYPITTPDFNNKELLWQSPGVGGIVAHRGIKFHYGKERVESKGCFIISSNYTINPKTGLPCFNINESKAAYKSFCSALGKCEFYDYAPKGKSYTRTGAKYNTRITYKLSLQ